MRLIMQEKGFQITAAAAIVSQHPFSDLVGEGRPSPVDFKELSGFAKEVSKIVISDKNVNLPFNTEIPPYYIPHQRQAQAIDWLDPHLEFQWQGVKTKNLKLRHANA